MWRYVVRGYGIRVNAVLLGFIDTKMNRSLDANAITAQIPSGRIGTVGDVASVVAFLAGPESSYVNGAEIEVVFVTNDVAAAFERATKAGATAVGQPAAKPWGQIVAYVRDNSGNMVELCTPAP